MKVEFYKAIETELKGKVFLFNVFSNYNQTNKPSWISVYNYEDKTSFICESGACKTLKRMENQVLRYLDKKYKLKGGNK